MYASESNNFVCCLVSIIDCNETFCQLISCNVVVPVMMPAAVTARRRCIRFVLQQAPIHFKQKYKQINSPDRQLLYKPRRQHFSIIFFMYFLHVCENSANLRINMYITCILPRILLNRTTSNLHTGFIVEDLGMRTSSSCRRA